MSVAASPSSNGATSPQRAAANNILAHGVDPYEESDYRKSSSRTRANPLLVKIQTGKVRASTFALPPSNFTYGRRDQYEEEGVKEVVNSWQHHQPPPDSIPGRDFVRMNRTAVVKGAVSSKDIAVFRTTHDARLHPHKQHTAASAASAASTGTAKVDPNFTYGRPSKPSTPIHDVLTNTFQRNAIAASRRAAADAEVAREAEEARGKKYGSAQHTRASLGHCKIRAPPPKEPFKLEKFKNVAPRIGYVGGGSTTSKKAIDSAVAASGKYQEEEKTQEYEEASSGQAEVAQF